MPLIHPLPAYDYRLLFYLVIAIALDTALGILKALVKGTFRLSQVARFLRTSVLPLIGTNLVVAAYAMTLGNGNGALVATTATAAIAELVAEIGIKLGIKLPTPEEK